MLTLQEVIIDVSFLQQTADTDKVLHNSHTLNASLRRIYSTAVKLDSFSFPI